MHSKFIAAVLGLGLANSAFAIPVNTNIQSAPAAAGGAILDESGEWVKINAQPLDESGEWIKINAQPIDDTGGFIKISSKSLPQDPGAMQYALEEQNKKYEEQREAKFRKALEDEDEMAVMDEGTPDEISRAYFGMSQKDAELEQERQNQEGKIDLVALSQVTGSVIITVDLKHQRLSVDYVNGGHLLGPYKISTAAGTYITPTGTYAPYSLQLMHYSKKYHNSPMPHSIFFRGGYAIHGTYAVNALGRPASHGCIRLAPENATKVYELVQSALAAKMGVSIVIVRSI